MTDNVADCGPAKKHADEPVMISTADVEALTKFVRDNSVDGVMTGPGEFNIQNAIELCSSTAYLFIEIGNNGKFVKTSEILRIFANDSDFLVFQSTL